MLHGKVAIPLFMWQACDPVNVNCHNAVSFVIQATPCTTVLNWWLRRYDWPIKTHLVCHILSIYTTVRHLRFTASGFEHGLCYISIYYVRYVIADTICAISCHTQIPYIYLPIKLNLYQTNVLVLAQWPRICVRELGHSFRWWNVSGFRSSLSLVISRDNRSPFRFFHSTIFCRYAIQTLSSLLALGKRTPLVTIVLSNKGPVMRDLDIFLTVGLNKLLNK